ncbi:valine--tRNA ligase [Schleiferia thermophila]|jgi:valyl-tRNA synthetase|uniref:Valine--tRNA ligase n=1 Tax=Schleiferia thermophila TaxID=884107 RepID=A0A369A7L9_9FLAO|nr:valine--tRNA ligase [Schleiferia thermophila]KFD39934.1 valyl-tRNA synthetase [Schleiferia thermophila str. Yellowstone]RCX05352.1 valyl-tRNA synthetase [Schleiferia thermophila]
MHIPTKYSPAEIERRWRQFWQENDSFASTPDERPSYTIVIPPPNVTGVLHMGHMLNNTIQDVFVRRARMRGFNACWVPGTDHASIATEAKVVAMLREKGISKHQLTRDEFLSHAFEWKDKYGGIILEQLKLLGASCDWKRTTFTMDDHYYRAVIRVFVDLYHKGYIYRGLRMINWDCEARTALSNEEVNYSEEGEQVTFYYVKYPIKGSEQHLTIATVRPETIMGDVAVAVNPTDERYAHLIGQKVIVPLIGREIPIIADEYVEKDFGTGCLKVTPAHDPNDYEIGLRHNLPIVDILNDDGTLNALCEIPEFVGLDRFKVRALMKDKLQQAGLLVKTEETTTRIGRSERTNSVVEPRLSLQWFIRMKEISSRALQVVENGDIQLHPPKFINTYRHWMENVKDWCISRQLWWGHRIPAYYYGPGQDDFVVAETLEEALQLARKKSGNPYLQANDLTQDPDVLDTWASSWLWPLQVFGGFNDDCFDHQTGKINLSKNKELSYYYPTEVLVTAPEILFFWVARMIIAGLEYTDTIPFRHVYLTGIVRDNLGRKMSKSLGNSPDPELLMERYGTDAVRVGMLFSSPAGNDLLFDEKLCEQGRNFANKIWNAFRLISSWTPADQPMRDYEAAATHWFSHQLSHSIAQIDDSFEKFRISEALLTLYELIWDKFCSWYLEWIKPPHGQQISVEALHFTESYFFQLMRLLHPFMPFITEEIHRLSNRDTRLIMQTPWPQPKEADAQVLADFQRYAEMVSAVRNFRNTEQIHPKEKITLHIHPSHEHILRHPFLNLLTKLAGLHSILTTPPTTTATKTFLAAGIEFLYPIDEASVDLSQEIEKIQQELDYTRGFLDAVLRKVNNPKFMENAPEKVRELELKKKSDAEAKIETLTRRLNQLTKLNTQ